MLGEGPRAIDWQANASFRDVTLPSEGKSGFRLDSEGMVVRTQYRDGSPVPASLTLLNDRGKEIARVPKVGLLPPGGTPWWDSKLRPVPVPKDMAAHDLSLSQDGGRAAYLDEKNALHVWTRGTAGTATIATGLRTTMRSHLGSSPSQDALPPIVSLSPDGRYALCSELLAGRRQVWDLTTQRKLKDWSAAAATNVGLVKVYASTAWTDASDGLLEIGVGALWIRDPRTGASREILRPLEPNGRFAFSRDGQLVATAARDRIVIRTTKEGRELVDLPVYRQIPGHYSTPVADLRFTPDGRSLVVLFYDNTLRVFTVGPYPGAGRRASLWSVLGRAP